MSEFVLEIFDAKGNVYWTENFSTKKELNAWLDEEKTRPYWKKNFTTKVTDNREALESKKAEGEKVLAEVLEKKNQINEDLKSFVAKEKKTVADCGQAIANLISYLGIE